MKPAGSLIIGMACAATQTDTAIRQAKAESRIMHYDRNRTTLWGQVTGTFENKE